MKFLTCILFIFMVSQAKEVNVKQLFNVTTVKVKEQKQSKSIDSFGFVKFDDSKIYDVAPRFGGFIEKLYANKIYTKVKQGQVLAQVYSPEVLKAKDEYKNSLNYSKNKAMIEGTKTKLQLLEVPNSEIKNINKNRTHTNILSPTNGFIIQKPIHNNCAFNAKETIFKIANLDTVWVEVKIHQKQLQSLQNIEKFILSTPALKTTYEATKYTLYPVIHEKEESFTLRLELENKDQQLKPGMFVHVKMNETEQTYLTLPATAVIRKNGTFYVFMTGEYEGEYEPLEVTVEVLDPDTYIIKDGLHVNDTVVNNALFMMDSDAQINGLY